MKLGNLMKSFAIPGASRLEANNAGLRILALMLAVGLWVFVNTGVQRSVESLTIPISYRTLPAGMVIMNHPPEFVKIEVAGPRTILSLVNPEFLTLKLDLAGVALGQSEFKVFPAMFNMPRGINVTSISPDQLALDIDHLVTREVAVHLAIQGKVADGYQISSVEIAPPSVTAMGPSRFLATLASIGTEPFDLHGVNADDDRSVDIAAPDPSVRFSTDTVQVKVDVAEMITDREFRAVEVQVKDSGFKFRVDPKQASLTIRGPAARLASLAPKGLVYVDAKGIAPGSHELPLQVSLPDGMQLVRQSPDKVRLRMYREKLTSTADANPS